MRVEDIVEGMNRHIESKRKELNINTKGHIVLLRNININSSFKAYKEYVATLWFVKGTSKQRVITVSNTAKVLDGQEEMINREVNIKLIESLLNLAQSDLYNLLINGDYKE